MTAQWDDDVHHALHVALTGETHGYYADFAGGGARDEAGPLGVLAKVLTRGFLHDGTMSTFRGPPVGRARSTSTGSTRVGCSATSRRTTRSATGWRATASPRSLAPGLQAAGAALYLLAPTTPMVFMGEEWAASTPWQFFTSFEEDVLADAVRRGRRAEFGGARLVRGRRARPAGPRHPRPLGARLGRAATRAATRACCAGTPRAPPCAATSLARRRRRASPTSPSSHRRGRPLAGAWRTTPADGPAFAVVVNLADRAQDGAPR